MTAIGKKLDELSVLFYDGVLEGIELKKEREWLWLYGDTKPFKEKLKELGFRWSKKRSAWYWAGKDAAPKSGNGNKKINKNRLNALLYERAIAAGHEAAHACKPTPMLVGTPTTPLGNDIDYSKPTEYVEGGVCGFAWVIVRPGNCSFANWLKKNNLGSRSDYWGGVYVKYDDRCGQSYERKMAFAGTVAEVLSAAGINARADGRLD